MAGGGLQHLRADGCSDEYVNGTAERLHHYQQRRTHVLDQHWVIGDVRAHKYIRLKERDAASAVQALVQLQLQTNRTTHLYTIDGAERVRQGTCSPYIEAQSQRRSVRRERRAGRTQ